MITRMGRGGMELFCMEMWWRKMYAEIGLLYKYYYGRSWWKSKMYVYLAEHKY